MTIEFIRNFLMWSSVINIAILLCWFLLFVFTHDFIYRYHSKWFQLSVKRFDSIQYMAMAFYKICILFFNVIPYIVLFFVK